MEAPLTTVPHDLSDLYLAPVVLALEARIEELGLLDPEKLALHVALVSDQADFTRDMRESALLIAVQHLIDCHNWELSWDPRGIRLTHGLHGLVLGVPPTFVDFLAGAK